MKLSTAGLFVALVFPLSAVEVSLDFDSQKPISPLIYGYNQDHEEVTSENNYGSRRLGGNRMSTFNWEINVENSGEGTNSNWGHIKGILGVNWNDRYNAGEVYKHFHQENLDNGITSIVTVPILGWVAADDKRTVTTGPHGTDSLRWNKLVYEKGAPFSLQPDTTDRVVYLDESINFLVKTFGDATTKTGVKYISLGNEPGLWSTTHELLQDNELGAEEYVEKLIAAAKAVKAVDSNVKVIAGEFAGICLYDLRSAPDWTAVGSGYDWFPDYLLDKLKEASDEVGFPLIDIIAIHNYPQHKVGSDGSFSSTGVIVKNESSTLDYIRKTRMDFARSMWDTTYIEPSWLTNSKLNGESNAILVRLQRSIDTYFPGVKMMVGEFDYGDDNDISHGIAMADLLGVLGNKGVEIATRWDLKTDNEGTFTNAAYQLFRNYDGNKSSFGDVAIDVGFDDRDNSSLWASLHSETKNLHLVALNKDLNNQNEFVVALNNSKGEHSVLTVYGFDAQSATITERELTVSYSVDTLRFTMPALSAYHLIIKGAGDVGTVTEEAGGFTGNIVQSGSRIELSLPSAQNGKLSMLLPSGREVYTSTGVFKAGVTSIDIENLSKGIYLMSFEGGDVNILKRIIVK